MKDAIITALKTRYKGTYGVSEEFFDGVATMLAYSVNSKEGIDEAVKNAEPIFKRMQSENDKYRKERTDLQKRIDEFEKSKKAEEGNGAGETKKPKSEGDDMPTYFKDFMTRMETIANEVKSLKGEKLETARKAELNSLIKDLPQSVQKSYSRYNVTSYSEEDFQKLKDEVRAEVESISKEISSKSFNPPYGGSAGQSKGEPTKEELADVMKRLHIAK